ncbi:hypothetical protein I1H34_20240 [Acaryochloris marina S15]|nr:hypothetical protein I1H34_20240 [Acaryochloris marina S15]
MCEYRVIDVARRQITVFRDLRSGDDATQTAVSDESVYPAFPDVSIEVRQ